MTELLQTLGTIFLSAGCAAVITAIVMGLDKKKASDREDTKTALDAQSKALRILSTQMDEMRSDMAEDRETINTLEGQLEAERKKRRERDHEYENQMAVLKDEQDAKLEQSRIDCEDRFAKQLQTRDEESQKDKARISWLENEIEELRGFMENNGLKPPPRKPKPDTGELKLRGKARKQ